MVLFPAPERPTSANSSPLEMLRRRHGSDLFEVLRQDVVDAGEVAANEIEPRRCTRSSGR